MPAGLKLAPDERRIEFVGVSLAQSNLIAQARVELLRDGVGTVAEATGADSTDSVLRLIAEATLEAVQRYFDDGGLFTVTAVEQMTVGGKPIVVVCVAHVVRASRARARGRVPDRRGRCQSGGARDTGRRQQVPEAPGAQGAY